MGAESTGGLIEVNGFTEDVHPEPVRGYKKSVPSNRWQIDRVETLPSKLNRNGIVGLTREYAFREFACIPSRDDPFASPSRSPFPCRSPSDILHKNHLRPQSAVRGATTQSRSRSTESPPTTMW